VPSPDPEVPSGEVPAVFAPAPQREFSEPPSEVENPPWNLWDVLRIVVVALITIGLFGMVAMALAAHGEKSREVLERLARNPRVVIPAQMAAYLVVIGYMVAIVKLAGRPFWTTIQWNFPARAAAGYGALGIALAILVQTASVLLPIPKSLPIDKYFSDAAGAYLMTIFGVTFAPLVEELFFRGFLYPVVARRFGVGLSVGITALCFALIHQAQLAHAWAPLLLLWFVGLALTAVRAWTKSVGASLCVHVGYNFTLFLLLYLASDHFRHLEKLS
jgi:membrane protease YdiL (CAAX protease family)